ncbi:MAG: Hsp20/alpha crystallin family protein [Candidatus Lokiarchaeota archaeon]|nr:Hsp20/alpha crystallin family protein [Candidatus Harpocratesius repetitus]
MALVENEKSQAMQKSENQEEKDEIYYRVFPDMRRRINYEDNTIYIEVSLPGVKKEDITLKALPTWFHLVGKRGHMEYSANQSFGAEIVPEKTEAKYDNGLLQITAHIRDPMDDAKEIEL